MQNAIAPNFVHALDASHLTLTALDMKSKALQMVGIHDSFGTHPCDVDEMHRSIREKFIHLYSDRHILSSFLFDVGVHGEAPLMGSLDLSGVRTSEFFFC
jgi:DNA-directed RNA polymerase